MKADGQVDGPNGLRVSVLGGFNVSVGTEKPRPALVQAEPLKEWVVQGLHELTGS